ncbi:retrovirus-related pol polyprotein from transposon TNT 1-94 [Tanacetum coccineum]
MANLSEDIQSAAFDIHPPMLDRELLDEGIEGALHLRPERDIVFADLTLKEKERYKADIYETNILLQGLPKDTLINHYTDAKDIWDNVKMLLEGSELTKDERESQLYDDFKHLFKLNRGLKTSNYDQLYAYLKQREAHANENKMMLERYTQHAIDPLAFVSNISPHQYPTQSLAIPQSAYVPPVTHQPQFADNTQLDSELHLTQGTKLQFKTAGLLFRMFRVDITEVRHNRGQWNNARGAATTGNRGFQNKVGNANPGQAKPIKCYNCNRIGHIARQCTHPKRQQSLEYFKDKMLLMHAQENGVVLDEEQLLFIAGGQTNTFDDDVDEAPIQDLALNEDKVFQADQCDAFESDVE